MLVEPSETTRRDRDRALIEAHCRGDESVFPVIVREHYAALLARARRRLGSHAEAEDAVQETFERAYRGLCRLDGEYRIGAWLHRIVANVCHDHAASRTVQRALPERLGAQRATVGDVSDHVSDPVVIRAVQDALDALPAAQRQTFWLHEMNGLTYPEVAEQLGISEDNARARVHRARAALQRSLVRVRDAVAAVLLLPFGVRAWSRHAKHASDALADGSQAAQGAAPSGLTAHVAHATNLAYAVSATPVPDLAVSTASSGPNALVVLAASVATVVGGVFAAPVVTGSSGSSGSATEASGAAVSAPAEAPASSGDGAASGVVSIVAATVEAEAPVTVPATVAGSMKAVLDPDRDWVTAGADATAEFDWGPAPAPEPGAAPRVSPCPWLADYPGIRASLPGRGAVVGTVDPVAGAAGAGVSISFASNATLRIAAEPDGPTTSTLAVALSARACLEPGESALVVDVTGPDGTVVELRGPLMMRFNDSQYVFRGSVVPRGGHEGWPLPWGLPDRFVAQLDLNRTTQTATLDVVFIGAPGVTISPTTPTTVPPTTVPSTTPTTAPPTTVPSTTTTTVPSTTTTTGPPVPPSTVPPTTVPPTTPTTAPPGGGSSP